MDVRKSVISLLSGRSFVQFVKYFIGGGLYFWTGYIIFSLGYSGLHWTWWLAKMLADIVGWSLNYLAQRYWAFNAPGLARREGLVVKKYVGLTILNLGLDYLIVGGLKAVGISPYIGLFISAGFFTVWNSIWYRSWVFLSHSKETK